MYTMQYIYRIKNSRSSLLLGVYPLLLIIFWVNEFSFHSSRQVFTHLNCFIALCVVGCGSWLLQIIALVKIRNSDELKLFKAITLIYYLLVVLLMPIILMGILLFFNYTHLTNFYIPDQLFGIVLRLTTLSIMSNLLIDIYLLSKQKYKAELKARKMELAKQRVEMDMFKSQLNPHFLYNTLNTLCYLTMQDQQKAVQYSRQFADMYGYILKHIHHDWVKLSEELAIVENYFALQQIKTGSMVMLNIQVDDSIIQKWSIAPMAIQLLLENAIKHNGYNKNCPLEIHISITTDGYCTVINKINPLLEKTESSGWGLYNLIERYKLISEMPVRCFAADEIFKVQLPLKLTE